MICVAVFSADFHTCVLLVFFFSKRVVVLAAPQKLLNSWCFLFQSICGAFFFSLEWIFILTSAAVALRPISANGSSSGPPSSSSSCKVRSAPAVIIFLFSCYFGGRFLRAHLCAVAADGGARGPGGARGGAAVHLGADGAVAYRRTLVVWQREITSCYWCWLLNLFDSFVFWWISNLFKVILQVQE